MVESRLDLLVAFTPKGGCPLKLDSAVAQAWQRARSSIHPQGWVPIETKMFCGVRLGYTSCVAFTPKGGCPLKLLHQCRDFSH